MPERAPQYLIRKTAETAQALADMLEKKGMNPTIEPPQDPDDKWPVWTVHFTGIAMLPTDGYSPQPGGRHWGRPEYHDSYGTHRTMKPDFTKCCAGVMDNFSHHQCARKAVADPDWTGKPTRCAMHSRAKQAERRAKHEAEAAARRARWDKDDNLRKAKDLSLELVKAIAAGHNDPRGAAQELLDTFGLSGPATTPKDEAF